MEFRKWKCFSLVQDPVLQLESMAMEKLKLGFVERNRVQDGFALLLFYNLCSKIFARDFFIGRAV